MKPRLKPTALVTGGSEGLGLELVRTLTTRGWKVVTDARDGTRLLTNLAPLPGRRLVHPLTGDITDADHRRHLVGQVARLGGLDLLVLNASTLGPLPMRPLSDLSADQLESTLRGTTVGNAALMIALTEQLLERHGCVVGISSDAAVEHYETWGPYGAAKAALDHLVQTFATETGLTAYVVDPGDMRTRMHRDAFPGEDLSDRPLPAAAAARLLALLDDRPATGRYRLAQESPAGLPS